MKNKKLKITVFIALALLTVATLGVTVARLMDNTSTLTNTFEPGSIETGIDEDGEGDIKKSRIENTGKLDCLVRVRVTISPQEAASVIKLTGIVEDDWDWSQWSNGDGYVYYKDVLPAPGENEKSFTSYLFTGVALKNKDSNWKSLGIDTFDVTVYEESVQVDVHNGTEIISALDESGNYDIDKAAAVWAVYDASSTK